MGVLCVCPKLGFKQLAVSLYTSKNCNQNSLHSLQLLLVANVNYIPAWSEQSQKHKFVDMVYFPYHYNIHSYNFLPWNFMSEADTQMQIHIKVGKLIRKESESTCIPIPQSSPFIVRCNY